MNHYLNELGDYLLEVGENAHISVLTSLWLDMRAAVLVITCHALSASHWQGALSWQSAGPAAGALLAVHLCGVPEARPRSPMPTAYSRGAQEKCRSQPLLCIY